MERYKVETWLTCFYFFYYRRLGIDILPIFVPEFIIHIIHGINRNKENPFK